MGKLALTKANLLRFIIARRHVSFVEIKRCFEETDGDTYMFWDNQTVMLWEKMSSKLVDLLQGMLKSEEITMSTTTVLTYLIDGGILRLPVAKQLNRKYKKTRWLPVVFNPREQASDGG